MPRFIIDAHFSLSLFSLRWLFHFTLSIIFHYSAFIFSRAIADTPFHFSLPLYFHAFATPPRRRDISPDYFRFAALLAAISVFATALQPLILIAAFAFIFFIFAIIEFHAASLTIIFHAAIAFISFAADDIFISPIAFSITPLISHFDAWLTLIIYFSFHFAAILRHAAFIFAA
jgi:hypothetical protein